MHNFAKVGIRLRVRLMSHLQFSRAILLREHATKSRDKVAYAVIVQFHAVTMLHK